MTFGWSLFVIVGTVGSLGVMLWLLFANRKGPSQPHTTGHSYDGIEELDNPLPMWWVGLFVGTIAISAVYLAYYPGLGNFAGLGGWSSENQLDADTRAHEARFAPLYAELGALPADELSRHPQVKQIGRRLFVNTCATCHGTGARGGFGFPDLTDEEWLWGGDFATIETTITGGRIGAMPGWSAALGDAGVADMASYVLRLAGQSHDPAAAERAAPTYATFCVACHGVDGKGSTQFGAPDLTNTSWVYGGSFDEIAFTIRHGRNGQMPAQQGALSPEKIRILAAYVKGLGSEK